MKRSEMVKLIEQYVNDEEYFSKSEIAEEILKAIEKAGMLPPYADFIINKEGHISSLCEWESEDE